MLNRVSTGRTARGLPGVVSGLAAASQRAVDGGPGSTLA